MKAIGTSAPKRIKNRRHPGKDKPVAWLEPNASGRWEVVKAGRPFVPVLRLQLGVNQLRTLTLTLSDYLSENLPQRGKVVA